jgi:5-formaminoimidazole-4-carboxamide-1-beta-D-ribofuranosyl 5'-monophosphate synthetase
MPVSDPFPLRSCFSYVAIQWLRVTLKVPVYSGRSLSNWEKKSRGMKKILDKEFSEY